MCAKISRIKKKIGVVNLPGLHPRQILHKIDHVIHIIITWQLSTSVEQEGVGNNIILRHPVTHIPMDHGIKARIHIHREIAYFSTWQLPGPQDPFGLGLHQTMNMLKRGVLWVLANGIAPGLVMVKWPPGIEDHHFFVWIFYRHAVDKLSLYTCYRHVILIAILINIGISDTLWKCEPTSFPAVCE